MDSNPQLPTVEHLRAEAAIRGVHPTAADLEAVVGFLAAILPAVAEIERSLPPEAAPADPFTGGGSG